MKIKIFYKIIIFFIIICCMFFLVRYINLKNIQTYEIEDKAIIKRLANNINDEWALEAIKYDRRKILDESTIVIGIIDSGLNLKSDKILNGYNLFDETNNVADSLGHGTDIASIILKIHPNIKILPIKILNTEKGVSSELLVKGIDYAVKQKVDVINISLGMQSKDLLLEKSIKSALDNNISIVAASGNNGNDKSFYPANISGVFSVISRNINNIDSAFNNEGIKKSFSAPGDHIKIEKNHFVTGTSYATPFVSAYVSIIKTYKNNISNKEIHNVLVNSSVDGNKNSYGFIKFDKLIRELKK